MYGRRVSSFQWHVQNRVSGPISVVVLKETILYLLKTLCYTKLSCRDKQCFGPSGSCHDKHCFGLNGNCM